MLTRYQLTLIPDKPCTPRPEWGYCLYAALLKRAPADFGENVHQDSVTPISQFFSCRDGRPVWTVTLLGESCEQSMGSVLEQIDTFELTGEKIRLQVTERTCARIADAEELLRMAAGHNGVHHLRFETAAAFKSQGQYVNLPTMRLVVQSLIKKWNGSIPECPIEDEDGQGMEAIAAGLRCRDFRLQNRTYWVKGRPVPGFVGSLTVENCLEGFHRQVGDALLIFAEFSGIGIKTTLGMGGITRT